MTQYAAVDLETTGLIDNGSVPQIICMSYCDGRDSGVITDKELMQHYLDNHYPVFHNANFDVAVLLGHGFRVGRYHDTMLMSYVANTNQEHSLKSWGERLGLPKLESPWDDKFPTVFTEELATYAVRDAELTYKLFKHLQPLLNDDDFRKIYELELSMGVVIQEFEAVGLPINTEEAYLFKSELEQQASELEAQILKIVSKVPAKKLKTYKKEHTELAEYFVKQDEDGYHYQLYEPFNINSRHHKAWALQHIYGWKPDKVSKDGTAVVDAETLDELDYPLSKLFGELSKVNKVLNTFVKPLLEQQDERGFIHCSVNQTVTRTGRLSSSSPNLQNIPANGELGKRMRHLFGITHPDLVIVQADLSNIEARLFAYYLNRMCNDPLMAHAFINGLDLHQANADNWGCSRQMAKKVLYLTLYGGGASKLAADAKIPLAEAEQIISNFTDNCPVEKLKSMVWSYTRRHGYIRTLLGRHLHYPEINSKDRSERGRAERQCFNALLQGSAADIIKDLTVKSYPIVKRYGGLFMMQVHDELLILAHKDDAHELCEKLTKLWCSQDYIQPVPVVAEFKFAKSWGELH